MSPPEPVVVDSPPRGPGVAERVVVEAVELAEERVDPGVLGAEAMASVKRTGGNTRPVRVEPFERGEERDPVGLEPVGLTPGGSSLANEPADRGGPGM